ncbi:ImmA/IrrE family metallo-endopeptidase [Rhizobium leguminosarum]|uniref:ImmA/IrrE family metallo-endopeptidase n=1 Tax=Rhizobium leguminosarum TaxID=384 RepID=UPI000FF2E469|nr:ImmA/IrrE family metallo-endopeptidase [Rhizobium leguminosarum]RWY67862.1 ImmA/IrrE family metallo-endopeptidase [Rhizobium leguminosarum]
MNSQDFVVPARSWDNIHSVAETIRNAIGLSNVPYVPIVDVLEKIMDHQLNMVRFEVGDHTEMGGAEGLADPNGEFIIIREDVYEKAVGGDGRARFTIAHELGHFFLHTGIPLARSVTGDGVKPFCKSEPQANQFAAEFLMPRSLITPSMNRFNIAINHGVSDEAANLRFKYLSNLRAK